MAASVISFGLLSLLHTQLGRLAGWDRHFQAAVHGWARPWLTLVMLSLTWMGRIEVFVPASVLAVLWMVGTKRLRQALVLGFAIGGALLLNEGLKVYFHRVRPAVAWSIGDETTYSFPSGHALFSSVLYGILVWLVPGRFRLAAVGLAILLPLSIGLSRIYLGMHYPSDVLAGYVVGAVWLGCLVRADQGVADHSPASLA